MGMFHRSDFGPSTFAQFAEAGKRHRKALTPAREECNKYDLIAAPCF